MITMNQDSLLAISVGGQNDSFNLNMENAGSYILYFACGNTLFITHSYHITCRRKDIGISRRRLAIVFF